MSLRADFVAFDDRLARAGVPPLTGWWREGIGRWLDEYEAGGALELVACVGRGAAKSTALYKLALFFTLFGDFAVPTGERHLAVVLSRLKEEASKAIPIIAAWLKAIGVPHHVVGDVIEIDDMPRGIRVVAASVAATSGWRCFFVGKDERSKWPGSELDERDAEEIDTSATAMTATHERAPMLAFGSAWVAIGTFHEAVTAGTTADRVVLGPAPTWVAAPHVSEKSCRKKEPNPKKFGREYKCVFDEAIDEALLDAPLVTRAQRATAGHLPREAGVLHVAAMDASLGRNSWTLAIGAAREVDGRPKASILYTHQWNAQPGQHLDIARVLIEISRTCEPYGVTEVRCDQFHAESLAAICERLELGITLEIDKPSASQKLARYEGMLARFIDDAVEIPRDRFVRADLLAIRRRYVRGSNDFAISFGTTPDGRHADFAPSISLVLERIAVDAAPGGWLPAMRRIMAAEKSERDYQSPARLIAIEAHRDREHLREGQYRCDRAIFGTECEYAHADFLGTATWKAGDYKPTFSADAEPGLKHNAAAYFKRQYPGGQAA